MRERIQVIDALRGLALAGIAIAHFGEQYLGFMPPPGRPYNVQGVADGVLEALVWLFVRGKAFGIFSFLFGLSFALQMQRAEAARTGVDFRPRFAWRLVLLFGLGWLHGLAYNGDILNVYAALGLPLILFYRARVPVLLALAALLLVGAPRAVQRLLEGPATTADLAAFQQRMIAEAEEHWRAVSEGDVPRIVRFHATAGFRAKWEFQFGPMGRGYQTFGLFLLGLWTGRRVLEDVERHRALVVRVFKVTGVLALVLPLAAVPLFALGAASRGYQATDPGALPDFSRWPIVAGLGVFDAWNNAMTLFYVAAVALLALRPRWRARLLALAPVGQTALSVYVSQTMVGVLIYFGFGLGLLGRFGNSVNIPIGIGVFAVQAWACHAWLRRYRYGPLEWAWRCLTWLRREPLRRAAESA